MFHSIFGSPSSLSPPSPITIITTASLTKLEIWTNCNFSGAQIANSHFCLRASRGNFRETIQSIKLHLGGLLMMLQQKKAFKRTLIWDSDQELTDSELLGLMRSNKGAAEEGFIINIARIANASHSLNVSHKPSKS